MVDLIRTTNQARRLGWPVERGIALHIFFPGKIDNGEGGLNKFAHRVRLTGRYDIIVRGFVLQHQPHGLDVILSAAPVSPALQIAQDKIDIQAMRNPRDCARDFAGNKIFAAARRLVIVKNAVANKKAIRLSINTRQLCGERFGAAVRTGRKHRCVLRLRCFRCIAENFRT